MAETTKRKKLTRVETDVSELNKQKFYCCRCGTAYPQLKGHFPVSHSPMYRGSKYIPLCGECVEGMFQTYSRELGSERAAMQRICMKLDLYWSHKLAGMVEASQNVGSYVRSYITKTNIRGYIGKTYDDTIAEEEGGLAVVSKSPSNQSQQNLNDNCAEQEVSAELIQFWGAGRPPQAYFDLEAKKKYYMSRYPEEHEFTLGDELLLKQISALELEIDRDSAAERPVDKNRALLASYISNAQLKPTKKKSDDSDSELENMPLGVGLQKWEQDRPLPPTPDELKDVSGMVKNIHTWVFGHLSKMVGLKNSACQLYEEAMEDLRVKPEFEDEDDDDTILTDFLSSDDADGGQDEEKSS